MERSSYIQTVEVVNGRQLQIDASRCWVSFKLYNPPQTSTRAMRVPMRWVDWMDL